MTKNENIIPKDVYKKLYLSAYLETFFSEINLETFKDKTGNTHGMKFSIPPPSKAIKIITKKLELFFVIIFN